MKKKIIYLQKIRNELYKCLWKYNKCTPVGHLCKCKLRMKKKNVLNIRRSQLKRGRTEKYYL